VRHFETIEELRLALLDFAAWYNTHWLVARHGQRTPAQIRADSSCPWIRPHDRRSRLSHNRGAVHGTVLTGDSIRCRPRQLVVLPPALVRDED
jgi:hypothetical protein